MTKPQQPELRRHEMGATDTDSAKAKADETLPAGEKRGPVPPGNQPGWVPREATTKNSPREQAAKKP